MKVLKRLEFGDPILRKVASTLTKQQIASPKIQVLIKNIKHTLLTEKLGVGLAAPQVGENLSIAVIAVRPRIHRTKIKPFDLVIINPKITQKLGNRKEMWEGCMSAGKSGLFALVPRYKKIEVKFYDEQGKAHIEIYKGLPAQVIQHEIDHLNGVLFVDLVKDTKSYMTLKEYKKLVVSKRKTT